MSESSEKQLNIALEEILGLIISNPNLNSSKLETYKRKIAKKYDVKGFRKNEEYYNPGEPLPDGMFLYDPESPSIIPTHHIQSSFLFNMEAAIKVNGFPTSDCSGYREETKFSIDLISIFLNPLNILNA